jgi:uncharacterized protein (DUF58 family)
VPAGWNLQLGPQPGRLNQSLARSYLVLVLLGAALAAPAPQAWIALALLALQALALFRAPSPQRDLPLTLATVALVPMNLAPLVGPIAAAAIPLPGLFLIEAGLRDLARSRGVPSFRSGRRSTSTLYSLTLLALALGFLGFASGSVATLLVAGALLLGVLALLVLILAATRGVPLSAEPATRRILVGKPGRAQFTLRNETAIAQWAALISPDVGVTVSPRNMEIGAAAAQDIVADVTPSLSGPAQPEIHVMLLDPWGLMGRGVVIHPLRIQAIPRARYAEWLARKYLEQPGSIRIFPAIGKMNLGRGVEFQRLREYQPGDRLKDVDWRRSGKFRELVTREYRDPQGGRTIILANLVAGDAEEADWVGYHLITSALTAAEEGITASLLVYNHREPLVVTGPQRPREILKQALRVSGDITLIAGQKRLLAPPKWSHLRQAAHRLGEAAGGSPESSLAQVLVREIQALEDLSQGHPLASALRRGLSENPPPATLTLVSRWNHDAEALSVELPRLKQLGYRVLDLFNMNSSPVYHA